MKTKLSQENAAKLARLQAALKLIPSFRSDVRERVSNSIDLTKDGCGTSEETIQRYEQIAATYGEDYEKRAAAEDAALAEEVG